MSSGESIIGQITSHLEAIWANNPVKVEITEAVFIVCAAGLDFAAKAPHDVKAELWVKKDGGNVTCVLKGSLFDVNDAAKNADKQMASQIEKQVIDAIISISSDPEPEGINGKTISVAVKAAIPVVGTGGTSVSAIATAGGNVIGCSGGSVSVTPTTRGICFAASLASYWGYQYSLPHPPTFAKFRAVVGAALPIILATSLAKLFSQALLECLSIGMPAVQNNASSVLLVISNLLRELVDSLSNRVIPVVVGAITCAEVSHMNEVSLLSGAAAGSLAGSMIGAFLAGTLSGYILPSLLVMCAQRSFFPTASTIVAVGMSGICGGAVVSSLQVLAGPLLELVFAQISLVYVRMNLNSFFGFWFHVPLGALFGFLTSWGSENGYYHAIMLPIIAFEMRNANFAVAGAFDFVCLCAPCAGVCAAAYLLTKTTRNISHFSNLGWRGFKSNLIWGDFVEACYPFTLHSSALLWMVRLSCAAAGALLWGASTNFIFGSAYLPFPLTVVIVWLQQIQLKSTHTNFFGDWAIYFAASLIAFFGPFLCSLVILSKRFHNEDCIENKTK